MMDFLTMKESLKAKFFPVLAVCGNDAWLRAKAVENVAATLDVAYPEMNKVVYEQPTDMDEILIAASTLPFFSKQKLIVVENFVFAQGGKRQDGKRAQEQKAKLEKYASQADDGCALVFVTENESDFDGVRYVEKINCNRLDQKSVVAWVTAFCKRKKIEIDRFAAGRLADFCLCDMARVSTETEKLCDYSDGVITISDVDAMVHRDSEYVVFDLSRAIAEKNGAKALDMVQNLLARGEDVRSLFSLLYNYYRRMYYTRVSEATPAQLAAKLGVKESAIRFASEVAQRYKPIQLKRAVDHFAAADAKLKAFYNEGDTFDLLIMQLLAL